MRKELLNRRDFLKVSFLATSALFVPGCTRRESEQVVGREDELEFSGLMLENNWIYPVGFNSVRFFDITKDFGLQPASNKPVRVLLTNDSTAYETQHEVQSHLVTVSPDDNPDRIEISCGRYVEEVRRITGSNPQTEQDELFLSTALSESIFNGFADLSAGRGEITVAEGNGIVDSYLERLYGLPLDDLSLIFTRVYIDEQNQGNLQA